MPAVPGLKLPGWTRRAPELTPAVDLWSNANKGTPLDRATFLDPANAVAFKMIGGAFGVLGAEVLGHYVPVALDNDRWGVYIREAGVAWLCNQLLDSASWDDLARPELLIVELARAVATHHLVHQVVERAYAATHGGDAYLALLLANAPRHPPTEESLADTLMKAALVEVVGDGPILMLDNAYTSNAGDRRYRASPSELVADLSASLDLPLDVGAFALPPDCPQYLVMEPHLPEQTATLIRSALFVS
jgi:hypothetical protein